MKIKLTLLLAALSFSIPAFAGPADGAAFAIRAAREASQQQNRTSSVAANAGAVSYVPSSSGKGGTVIAQNNQGATNIALFKSKKAAGECTSCCKADAKRQ